MDRRAILLLVGCDRAFVERARGVEGFVVREAPDVGAALETLGMGELAAVLIDARLGKVARLAGDVRARSPAAALLLVGLDPLVERDPLGEGFDDFVVAGAPCEELAWRVRLRVAAASRDAELHARARVLSHDVRGPLAVLLGQVELLDEGLVSPNQLPQMAATLRRQAERIRAVLDTFTAD